MHTFLCVWHAIPTRACVIARSKCGRRNHYEICGDAPLRHRLERENTVGRLLAVLLSAEERRKIGLRKG